MREFDLAWRNLHSRLPLVPGKEVLANLNTYLQGLFGVTITSSLIVDCCTADLVPTEMKDLIEALDGFGRRSPDDSLSQPESQVEIEFPITTGVNALKGFSNETVESIGSKNS